MNNWIEQKKRHAPWFSDFPTVGTVPWSPVDCFKIDVKKMLQTGIDLKRWLRFNQYQIDLCNRFFYFILANWHQFTIILLNNKSPFVESFRACRNLHKSCNYDWIRYCAHQRVWWPQNGVAKLPFLLDSFFRPNCMQSSIEPHSILKSLLFERILQQKSVNFVSVSQQFHPFHHNHKPLLPISRCHLLYICNTNESCDIRTRLTVVSMWICIVFI